MQESLLKIFTRLLKHLKEEQFGITNQIRRVSLSIAANISEGFSRQFNK